MRVRGCRRPTVVQPAEPFETGAVIQDIQIKWTWLGVCQQDEEDVSQCTKTRVEVLRDRDQPGSVLVKVPV